MDALRGSATPPDGCRLGLILLARALGEGPQPRGAAHGPVVGPSLRLRSGLIRLKHRKLDAWFSKCLLSSVVSGALLTRTRHPRRARRSPPPRRRGSGVVAVISATFEPSRATLSNRVGAGGVDLRPLYHHWPGDATVGSLLDLVVAAAAEGGTRVFEGG